MTNNAPRSREQRKADALAKLTASPADAWVASAADGRAHLVPLTLAWLDERVVLATDKTTRSARNIVATGQARVSLGGTRDVVMIDAFLDVLIPVAGVAENAFGAALAEGYAAAAGWDPRASGDDYAYLVLRPDRIQAWREVNEIAGRLLMDKGAWLV